MVPGEALGAFGSYSNGIGQPQNPQMVGGREQVGERRPHGFGCQAASRLTSSKQARP